MVLGVVLAVLVFLVIILLHELGHFFAAKAVGVGVIEYSIGMGPLLAWKRIGETVFSLRLVPFGGYCAMYGEESAEAGDKGQKTDDEVSEDAADFGKHKRREPDFKTDWDESQSLSGKSPLKRAFVYAAGPAMNFILGILAVAVLLMCFPFAGSPEITAVVDGSPAAESDIMAGDVIVGINGRSVSSLSDYNEYVSSHPTAMNEEYVLTVERDGERIDIPAERDPETNLFGITISSEAEEKTPLTVLRACGTETRYMVRMVADSIGMIARGEAGLNDMTGIVGVTALISESVDDAADVATENGSSVAASVFETAMYLMALISINLGIVNLFPIPALDGGRLLMCAIEGISRRRIPAKVEYAVNAVGMTLLMLLMCYLVLADSIRLITGTLF